MACQAPAFQSRSVAEHAQQLAREPGGRATHLHAKMREDTVLVWEEEIRWLAVFAAPAEKKGKKRTATSAAATSLRLSSTSFSTAPRASRRASRRRLACCAYVGTCRAFRGGGPAQQ